MQGGDLYDVLKTLRHEHKHFTTEQIKQFATQLIEGLAFMHAKAYSHPDIKPENLLVDAAHTRVKFCDLGHSQKMTRSSLVKRPTQTSGYEAPEIVLARRPYTTKVDVWALACTLYEIASRLPLFDLDWGESGGDNEEDTSNESEGEEEGETSSGSNGDCESDAGDAEDDETGTNSSKTDTWSSTSGDTVTSSAESEVRIYLLRLQQLFGDAFIPRTIRREERSLFTSRGKVRGMGYIAPTPLVDRLRDETALKAADAIAFAEMLHRAFQFDPQRRADCLTLRTHGWLIDD